MTEPTEPSSPLPPADSFALDAAARTLQDLPRQIERMHRRFLDVVRLEMGRLGVRDISPVQVLMLSNIGPGEISVRDLIERGYYLGSNASYNLKQLIDGGYVDRQTETRDHRAARLHITDKGRGVLDKLTNMQLAWARPLSEPADQAALETTLLTLRRLERCWSDTVSYALPPDAAPSPNPGVG